MREGSALRIGLSAAALAAAGALAVLGVAGDDGGGASSPPVAATATPAGTEPAPAPVQVPAAIPRLRFRPPGRAFAGHPLIVTVRARAVQDGAPVLVQRATGAGWDTVAGDAVVGGRAAVLVRGLPAGTARLRARVPAGSFAATSRPRALTVRRPRRWRTRGLAGTYAGPHAVRFAVAPGGRALTGFRGRVRSVCSGVSATVRVAELRLAHVRVDPAGRFAGRGRVGGGTRVEVRGRLLGDGAGAVRLRVAAGRCAAASVIRARRAGA